MPPTAQQWATDFLSELDRLRTAATRLVLRDDLTGSPAELLDAYRRVVLGVCGSEHPNALEAARGRLRGDIEGGASRCLGQVVESVRQLQQRIGGLLVAGVDPDLIATAPLSDVVKLLDLPPFQPAVTVAYPHLPAAHELGDLFDGVPLPTFMGLAYVVLGEPDGVGRVRPAYSRAEILQATAACRRHQDDETQAKEKAREEEAARLQKLRESDPKYRERQQAGRIAALEAQVSRLTSEPRA